LTTIPTWGGASIGQRADQEDWFTIVPAADGVLLVVADGMGGHAAGQVASRLAGEAFTGSFTSGDNAADGMMQSMAAANRALADAIAADEALAGMGTTLLAAYVTATGLRWISVGDSVLMLVRDGAATRLNADHSLGAYVDAEVARGAMTETQARLEGPRNGLLSVVAGDAIDMVEVVTSPVALIPGDLLLVASDGIHTLGAAEIESVLATAGSTPDVAGKALLAAVLAAAHPRQDNTTIVLARIPDEP
jgi:serine/threonine protein phosphatase PrpC